jgi:glycosyltransferase involved in cell wall biosynthesis
MYKKENLKKFFFNIIYVIPRPDGGGAELLFRKVGSLLHKLGFNISIIYFQNPSNLNLMPYEYCLHLPGPRSIKSIWSLRKIIIKLIQKKPQFTIVHTHLTWPLYYLIFARPNSYIPKIFGLKLVNFFTEHNTFNRRRKFLLLKPLERYIYSKYYKITCVSEGVRKSLDNWLNDKNLKKKLLTIPNGSRVFDIINRKKIDPKKIRLLSIGSLTTQKGFDIAIQTIALLKDNIKSYTILGEGDQKKKLLALAEKLGVSDKLILPGYVKNIKPYIAEADFGLMPSRWEGFGLVAIEMLSTGLPLISTRVHGHSEVVGTCSSVQLVKPNSSKALATGILKAINHLEAVGVKKSALEAKKQSEIFTMDSMIFRFEEEYLKAYDKFELTQKRKQK